MQARRRYLVALLSLMLLALLTGVGWVVMEPFVSEGSQRATSDSRDDFTEANQAAREGGKRERGNGNQGSAPDATHRPAESGANDRQDAGEHAPERSQQGEPVEKPETLEASEQSKPEIPVEPEVITLRGRVVDESNYGIAGAVVKATLVQGKATEEATAIADSAGAFALPVKSGGGVSVILIAKADGYTDSDLHGPVSVSGTGAKDGIELRLFARCSATGRVLDPRGEPVADAFVEVFQEYADPKGGPEPLRRYALASKTDAEGRYSVASIRAGTWGVRCVAKGAPYAVFEKADMFTAIAGRETGVADVMLEHDTSARIRLVRSDGQAIAPQDRFWVSLRVQGDPRGTNIIRQATCDAQGVMLLANMDGYDQIRIELAGFGSTGDIPIVVFRGRENDLGEFRLEAKAQEKGQLIAHR